MAIVYVLIGILVAIIVAAIIVILIRKAPFIPSDLKVWLEYAIWAIVFIFVLLKVLALFGFAVASPAAAHDHWINHGNYQDPVFKWRCCGDQDCKAVDPGQLGMSNMGYRLPSGEVIPYARSLISEDQYAYICRWGSRVDNTNVRCLFIVPPGT